MNMNGCGSIRVSQFALLALLFSPCFQSSPQPPPFLVLNCHLNIVFQDKVICMDVGVIFHLTISTGATSYSTFGNSAQSQMSAKTA